MNKEKYVTQTKSIISYMQGVGYV